MPLFTLNSDTVNLLNSDGKIYESARVELVDTAKLVVNLSLSTNLELANEIFILYQPKIERIRYPPLQELGHGRLSVPKLIIGLKAWENFHQEYLSPIPRDIISFEKFFSFCM
jgi:hypothetical protein